MEGVWGIYRGEVTDPNDPQSRGRLRVRIPAVLGDTEPLWAAPCVPDPNRTAATFNPPAVGAPIWIQFKAATRTGRCGLGFR